MLELEGCEYGSPHHVSRESLYNDCINLYESNSCILKEYPFRVSYKREQAVDTGGVARDFFSAFWDLAYTKNMDGASTYLPAVNPHADFNRYTVLGTILAHGFMACGFMPIRLAFPVIAYTLLGCNVKIPDTVVIDAFIDYISTYESSIFQEALQVSKKPGAIFLPQLKASLVDILGNRGCMEIPTANNIRKLITEVSKYELITKPLGALQSLRAGVPTYYHPFFQDFSVQNLYDLYRSLNATHESVLCILKVSDEIDANQSRVFSYLKTFIGNLNPQDLSNFLRFTTGSSVMIDQKISVTFNTLCGLAQRPISHTCSCVLELPATYTTYPSFADDFLTILRSEVAWPMQAI